MAGKTICLPIFLVLLAAGCKSEPPERPPSTSYGPPTLMMGPNTGGMEGFKGSGSWSPTTNGFGPALPSQMQNFRGY